MTPEIPAELMEKAEEIVFGSVKWPGDYDPIVRPVAQALQEAEHDGYLRGRVSYANDTSELIEKAINVGYLKGIDECLEIVRNMNSRLSFDQGDELIQRLEWKKLDLAIKAGKKVPE